jgi:hypothetical protein
VHDGAGPLTEALAGYEAEMLSRSFKMVRGVRLYTRMAISRSHLLRATARGFPVLRRRRPAAPRRLQRLTRRARAAWRARPGGGRSRHTSPCARPAGHHDRELLSVI